MLLRSRFRNAKLCAVLKANKDTRLGRWLTENDVTYAELAERMGITDAAIYHWIAGRNFPNAEKLLKLSEITSIAPGELLASFEKESA
jgi:transcriptional regulator with XRE-family HTH domain